MALKNTRSNDTYVSILSDGTLRVSVPEGTEGAVKREYETSDGKTGKKFELVYTEIAGFIKKISFYDGDYGKLIQLKIEDETGEAHILSVNTGSNFGEDIMKKLPNIDLEEPVKFAPFSFDDDKGKKKRGVTIYQDEEKVQNYFFDPKKKANIHGFPSPKVKKGKPLSKDEWKVYFMEARIFLIDYITENFDIEEAEVKEGSDEDLDDIAEKAEKINKGKNF